MPNTYDGNGQRAVVVDEAGTGLAFSEHILVTEAGEVDIESAPDQPLTVRNDGAGGIQIRADDAGGVMVQGRGDGGVTIKGDGAGGVNLDARGSYGLDAVAGAFGGNHLRMSDDVGVTIDASAGKPVNITGGGSSEAEGEGGNVTITAGSSTGTDSTSGTLELSGGYGTPAVAGEFVTAGDLVLRPGRGTDAGGTTHGAVKLEAFDRPLADANNGQVVTYGAAIGPGAAPISIKRWIPVTVDGVDGWLPHFGV
ncbi:MAG TPA: hypothetical protein VJN68_10090 [Burkholderiaceae bacterium]|nr:hypothetical protein [Burkholderiaceae bacterium]